MLFLNVKLEYKLNLKLQHLLLNLLLKFVLRRCKRPDCSVGLKNLVYSRLFIITNRLIDARGETAYTIFPRSVYCFSSILIAIYIATI